MAIVLSRTLVSFAGPDGAAVDSESIGAAVQSFFVIFVGSMLIGLLYGLLSAWVYKKLDLRRHDEMHFMESALSFAFPCDREPSPHPRPHPRPSPPLPRPRSLAPPTFARWSEG